MRVIDVPTFLAAMASAAADADRERAIAPDTETRDRDAVRRAPPVESAPVMTAIARLMRSAELPRFAP